MITIDAENANVIELTVDGKLLHEDYQRVLPELERIINEQGALRCLIVLKHITGMEPRAMLDDFRFDITHAGKITHCAVVTDARWLGWVSKLFGLFMPRCEVRVFEPDERPAAAEWLQG